MDNRTPPIMEGGGGKHTREELRQKQSLPLEAKIVMSQNRIRDWYNFCDGNVYVSFSGGKDSTVLLHLVRSMYPEVPAVFADTGLEYPEIREFVKGFENVQTVRPEMRFDEVVQKYGYPVVSKDVASTVHYAQEGREWALKKLQGLTGDGLPSPWREKSYKKWAFLKDAPFKIHEYCCKVMKKRPTHVYESTTGRYPYLGTMAAESTQRLQAWMQTGCNAYNGQRKKSTPIAFWTEQDVLQYLIDNNLPIASCYGQIEQDSNGKLCTTGLPRTGCMFCMFGVQREKSPNRFERMKETHPKQYDYCMRPVEENGLGLGAVLDYLKIPH